jgi:outer membrane protein
MRKLVVAVLAALALAPAARAAETKIVVVDFQRAMMECEEGKNAVAGIKKDSEEKGKVLEAKQKEIEAAIADFEKGKAVLSDQARDAKTEELQKRRYEWNQAMAQLQNDVNDRLSDASKDVGEKMKLLVKSIAEAENIQVVLDRSAVVWGQGSLDITNEVIRKYNAKYPLKAGAAAGGTKPASGTKPK